MNDQFDLQTYCDGLFVKWQRERAETQMTLGKLIKRLEELHPHTKVPGLCNPHSYRGYYSDIAFQLDSTRPPRLALDLLADCRAAMGQVFEGYKGGEYVMGALTPVWIADYGMCGRRLIAIRDDGSIQTAPDSD